MAVRTNNQVKQVSPVQRAEMFAQMTRQHIQNLPVVTGGPGARLSFNLPKVRLLSKVSLLVEATVTAIHASLTTYTPHVFAPYNLLRQIRVETNFGFTPWRVSGRDLYFMMLLSHNTNVFHPQHIAQNTVATNRNRAIQGITSSPSAGTVNTIKFMVDLPITLNDRDPVGMILLQNEETVVTVNIDIGEVADIAPAAAGFTFTLGNVTITPIIETFSIPANPIAFPDISILKLVQSQLEIIPAAGPKEIRLATGTTYRKLMFFVADGTGAGVGDNWLTGDIEIVVNQADTPYRIRPVKLADINTAHYGQPLPRGLYAFDFTSFMGLPNFSGARDYIDTERLTEFWLRFNPTAAGSVSVISEMLSQMR